MPSLLPGTPEAFIRKGLILSEDFCRSKDAAKRGWNFSTEVVGPSTAVYYFTDAEQYSLTGNFSVSMKFKTSTLQNCVLCGSRESAAGSTNGFCIYLKSDGSINALYGDGSSQSSIVSYPAAGYQDGKVHTVTFTVHREGGGPHGLYLFFDEVWSTQATHPEGLITHNEDISVGAREDGSEAFVGTIYSFQLWTTTLFKTEHFGLHKNNSFSLQDAVVTYSFDNSKYDPDNIQILDAGKYKKPIELGNGSTSSTYPTQGKNYLHFDGSQYLSLGLDNDLDVNKNGCIMLAFNVSEPDVPASGDQYLVSKKAGSGNDYGYSVKIAWPDNRIIFTISQPLSGVVLNSIYLQNTTTGIHTVCITWNEDVLGLKMYIDGYLGDFASSIPTGDDLFSATTPFVIGKASFGDHSYFNGKIYDVRVFDSSKSQIHAMHYHNSILSRLNI